MADVLQDTDLVMVNRGGTNYKLTGSEIKTHTRLQDTDLVMVQESGALYQVSIGTLKSSSASLIDGPTNFFIVQRGDDLFSVENPFRSMAVPIFGGTIDTSGLVDGDNGIAFQWTGASAIDGIPAELRFLKSDNTPAGVGINTSSDGTTTFSVGELNTAAATKFIVIGAFKSIAFGESKALTTLKWLGGSSLANWNRFFPQPVKNGYRMFELCSKLTHVFGMTGYGSAPPAGILTDLTQCFKSCGQFNGDISSWNVSEVTSFEGAFDSATTFNQSIDSWSVGNSTSFRMMFQSATAFDQPLNSWDVRKAKTFEGMFNLASTFNRPLNSWVLRDVNSDPVTTTALDTMFRNATLFNQNLTGWCVNSFAAVPNLFADSSGLDAANYPVWGTCP